MPISTLPRQAWWPPSRKIRASIALALVGDATTLGGAILHTLPGGYAAALVGVITSSVAVVAGYITSDA